MTTSLTIVSRSSFLHGGTCDLVLLVPNASWSLLVLVTRVPPRGHGAVVTDGGYTVSERSFFAEQL